MAKISHVDPIHMGDVPWIRDTNTVHVRQRVGRVLVIGSAKRPLLKVLIRVTSCCLAVTSMAESQVV